MRLSDLLICCDTNSLHLLKRLGQALHIVDIDFIIYESDTWTNPHYSHEASSPEDRLDAAGSALGLNQKDFVIVKSDCRNIVVRMGSNK